VKLVRFFASTAGSTIEVEVPDIGQILSVNWRWDGVEVIYLVTK
jgi:hypothetical protein